MISCIISCMNRQNNLLSSLNSWVESHPLIKDIVVVDWSSEKKLIENNVIKKLVDEEKITLVRVIEEKYFSLSKSYNIAYKYTNSQNSILLKLDSDYQLTNPSWIDRIYIRNNLLNNYFICGDWRFGLSLTGFLLVNKKDFCFYNENLSGWGFDDRDLYSRISNKVMPIIFFNILDYIKHIEHNDEDRTNNYEIKDKEKSLKQNIEISKETKEILLSEYETINSSNFYKEIRRLK
jgi:hypothetical protein